MRRFLLAAVICVTAMSGSRAADLSDLPILRGPVGLSSTQVNWNGFYAGGEASYSASTMDFTNAANSLKAFMFRNSVLADPTSSWALLKSNTDQAMGASAFAGYNFQHQDIVLSIEANYRYFNNLESSSSSSMSRAIANPTGENPPAGHTHTYNVTLTGSAAAQIKDLVTLRGRAGWAWDNFLPYGFFGVAVGRMDISRSVTSSGTLQDDYDVTVPVVISGSVVNVTQHHTDFFALPTLTESERKTNAFVFGSAAGIGFDYMLFCNVFLRAEYENVTFLTVKDTKISMNNVHVGIGYKF
jgi:outer membrane immunogenic protein